MWEVDLDVVPNNHPLTQTLIAQQTHFLVQSHGGKLGLPWITWIWTDYNPLKSREKGPQLKEATPRGQFISLYSHGGNSEDCGVFPCGATHSQLRILSKLRYM